MCITAETMLDGAPDAVKVACPVLAGGKAGDNIKGLPIGTSRLYPEREGHSETCKHNHFKHQRGGAAIRRRFLGESRKALLHCTDRVHLV